MYAFLTFMLFLFGLLIGLFIEMMLSGNVMLYGAVFGAYFTEAQCLSASLLFLLGLVGVWIACILRS